MDQGRKVAIQVVNSSLKLLDRCIGVLAFSEHTSLNTLRVDTSNLPLADILLVDEQPCICPGLQETMGLAAEAWISTNGTVSFLDVTEEHRSSSRQTQLPMPVGLADSRCIPRFPVGGRFQSVEFIMSIDSNKSASFVVLGASGGIGSEVARLLVKNGHRVLLASRPSEHLSALAEELCAPAYELDAKSVADVAACFTVATEQFGHIHGAVNCVGSLLLKPTLLRTSCRSH